MEFMLDTANVEAIRELNELIEVAGVKRPTAGAHFWDRAHGGALTLVMRLAPLPPAKRGRLRGITKIGDVPRKKLGPRGTSLAMG